MKTIEPILNQAFEAELSPVFKREACYYAAMDYLEYVNRDVICISERIDGVLTLIWNSDKTDLVGFKLKGFRYVFQQLKASLQLKDEHFVSMVETLELTFTTLCNKIFDVSDDGENKRRQFAYQEAKKIAEQDNVTFDAHQTSLIAA